MGAADSRGFFLAASFVLACGADSSGLGGGSSGSDTGVSSLSSGVAGESSSATDETSASSENTEGHGDGSDATGGATSTDGGSDGTTGGNVDGSTGGSDDGESTDTQGGGGECGVLPTIYRDFEESHPDFGCSYNGTQIYPGLVLEDLGGDQKPQYNPDPPEPPDNWSGSDTQITSAETFAQWYNTTPDVNVESNGSIPLTETAPGSGVYTFSSDDFTPLGDGNGAFTTEIHTVFQYKEGQTFSFTGDDDLWIFIDGKLAVDVGGMHPARTGSIELDTLGLVPDQAYTMDIFHAERCYGSSNFHIETTIACFVPQ